MTPFEQTSLQRTDQQAQLVQAQQTCRFLREASGRPVKARSDSSLSSERARQLVQAQQTCCFLREAAGPPVKARQKKTPASGRNLSAAYGHGRKPTPGKLSQIFPRIRLCRAGRPAHRGDRNVATALCRAVLCTISALTVLQTPCSHALRAAALKRGPRHAQALCARTFSALPVRARALRSRTLRGRTLRARTVSRIRACEPRRLRTRGSREFTPVWRTKRARARSPTLPRVTFRPCKEPLAGRGGQQQERRRARISIRAGFCAPEKEQRLRIPRVRARSAPGWVRRRALQALRRRMRTLRAPAKDARSAAVC